jgi:hypothetical protein
LVDNTTGQARARTESIREEWVKLDLATLITDLLAEVRAGSPKQGAFLRFN